MSSTNPYSSTETPVRRDRVQRFSVFGAATCFLGCVSCVLAWTGVTQVSEIVSPTFHGRMQELPIVKPVWEFFAPDTGTVVVAKVASNVQTTFLLLGLIGAIMIVTGMVMLYCGFNRTKTEDNRRITRR